MGFFESLVQLATHPAAQPIWNNVFGTSEPPDQDARDQAKLARLRAMQDEWDQEQPQSPPPHRKPGRPRKVPLAPGVQPLDVVRQARDEILTASADYKEALRFAREDGMQHPEVADRLAHAEEQIADVERFWLTPDRIASLPPDTQNSLRQLLKPFRRFRQDALNNLQTVDDLERVSAEAGQLATALQVASVVGTAPNITLPEAAPTSDGTTPYSAYAPDMSVDTGCLPCGRAHIAGSYASLKAAADRAAERGIADPEVQQRLAMVQEEIGALLDYDWTPAKIAASPPEERQVLDVVVEPTQELLTQVRTAQTPDDVAQAMETAQRIRETMKQFDQEGREAS